MALRILAAGGTVLLRAALLASAALVPSWAMAASSTGQVEEIVVTATRRDASLQKVPIAVVAVTADQLDKAGITATNELATLVPGLQVSSIQSRIQPYLRGVGTSAFAPGWENPVATYVDDIYIAAEEASLFSLNNISQIEVLKGPQGTLFGRNATGGAILIHTRKPTQTPTLDAEVGYGNYNTVTGKLYASGGLGPRLAADIAVYYSAQGDGWGTNLATGNDTSKLTRDLNLRSKWVAELSDANELTVIGSFSNNKTSIGSLPRPIPGTNTSPLAFPTVPSNLYDISGDLDPYYYTRSYGISASDVHEFSALKMTNTVSYQRLSNTNQQYLQPPPLTLDVVGAQKSRQFSYELQLSSNPGSKVEWTTGIYYFNAVGEYNPAGVTYGGFFDAVFNPILSGFPFFLPPGSATGIAQRFTARQSTQSVAGYGEATVPIFEKTKLTLGLRYVYEERAAQGQSEDVLAGGVVFAPFSTSFSGSQIYREPTYRVALSHQITPDIMGYVAFNHGFKSGGYNISAGVTGYAPPPLPVNPEKLDAYTAGLKSEWFGRKLRANIEGFYYRYANMQLFRFDGPNITVENAGKAMLYGADLDLQAQLTPELTFTGGLSLLHSEFTYFPEATFYNPVPGGGYLTDHHSAKGNTLPNAPELTFNLGLDYKKDTPIGGIDVSANYYFNDGFFSGPDNFLKQGSYGLFSASAGWTSLDEHWRATIWGRNLTDERYAVTLAEQAAAQYILAGAPRTYGFTLGYHF